MIDEANDQVEKPADVLADAAPQTAEALPVASDVAAEDVVSADAGVVVAENEQIPEEAAGDSADATESEDAESVSAEPVSAEPVSAEAPAGAIEAEAGEEIPEKQWYILKVQSNREGSIRDGLLRRIKVADLDEYFGDVIVPTEKVTEFKGKKKRVVERKLYPGYIMVNMAITDDTWFLVRETPGIGDFTGAGGKPTPMLSHEVDRIIPRDTDDTAETPGLDIAFKAGDRVKVIEGNFENFEGEVDAIDTVNGRVTIMIMIFGRSTPVELEYWQIETI